MLSLKNLIDHAGTRHGWNGGTVASILLDAFCLNSVQSEAAGFKSFEGEIRKIRKCFETASDDESALGMTRESIGCLERYAAAVERCVATQQRQMRQSVALLTESLVRISHGSEESARNLKSIGTQVENASGLDDLTLINEKLKDCVLAICAEATRQAEQNSTIRSHLEAADLLCANAESPDLDIDSVTGLAGCTSGSRAIRDIVARGKTAYVVAFAVDRLDTINLRFGLKVGDQVLLLFAQHVAQSLADGDLLFRWRGPSLIMLTERHVAAPTLASEVTKIAHSRLAYRISGSTREINVPIASSWTILRLVPSSDLADTFARLDEFAIH